MIPKTIAVCLLIVYWIYSMVVLKYQESDKDSEMKNFKKMKY